MCEFLNFCRAGAASIYSRLIKRENQPIITALLLIDFYFRLLVESGRLGFTPIIYKMPHVDGIQSFDSREYLLDLV
ncbi:MAG: hypothetical protein FWF66_02380 [Candidatus Bathyarchaeota archaeon]|nr:hypothetical protein [Candidatus Termiticorpusculum sp.]